MGIEIEPVHVVVCPTTIESRAGERLPSTDIRAGYVEALVVTTLGRRIYDVSTNSFCVKSYTAGIELAAT
jgi:hypothetical protein